MITSLMGHTDVLTFLVGALFVIVGYFIVRTLKSIDGNQKSTTTALKELTELVMDINVRLANLEGEHKVIMSQGGHVKQII